MTNNSNINEAILGLMRMGKFGSVDGEDIVSGLEQCKGIWKVVLPGTDIGTQNQIENVLSGRLLFDELRIRSTKADYLDLYQMASIWRPNIVGVSFVDGEDVELLLMW